MLTYDPHWDTELSETDCESPYCDEFYDEESKIVRTSQEGGTEADCNAPNTAAGTKPPKSKRKSKITKDVPELKLPESKIPVLQPTVIWRSRDRERNQSPVQDIAAKGCGKKVSLLSDWREKFGINTRGPDLNRRRHQGLDFQKPSTTMTTESDGFLEDSDNTSELPELAKTNEKYLRRSIEESKFSIRQNPIVTKPDHLKPEGQQFKMTTQNGISIHSGGEFCEVERDENVNIADTPEVSG